jgi:hypothetical protein
MPRWQDKDDYSIDFEPSKDGWIETFPGDVLDEVAAVSQHAPLDALEFDPKRKRTPEQRVISMIALAWLDTLPNAARPVLTAERHPHVVNKMAVIWRDDSRVRDYFEELLLDTRQGRQGFGHDVLDELGRLLEHFEAWQQSRRAA